MKLAILGAVTLVIGVTVPVDGLVWIGGYWIALGYPAFVHGRKIKQFRNPEQPGTTSTIGEAPRQPAIDGRTFAAGTALLIAVGAPSLAIGLLELGIDEDHTNWRWLPVAVGVWALGAGVLGGLLFLLGGAVEKRAGTTKATVPATIWIRSVSETGTYINNRPRMEFELRVEPDAATGVPAYDVVKKATVPFTAMNGLRVGDGFRADVEGPAEPTSMEIHWDQPVPGTSPVDATAGVETRLAELDRLHRSGSITDAEYRSQRDRILGSL